MSATIPLTDAEVWPKARLSEIGTLLSGQSPPSAAVNREGKGTVYVSGPEQWDGHRVHADKWTTEPKCLAPSGSIFITVKGAGVGKIFPGIASAIGRDIYAFVPDNRMSARYVEHALRHSVQDVLRQAVGDIPGLSRKHILVHKIAVPPLEVQEELVAEIEMQFSRLDEALANLQRVKTNLKRYKAAVLKAAVEGRLVPTEAELARREGRSYETGSQLVQRILDVRRREWRGKGKQKLPDGPDKSALPDAPEGWAWATVGQLAAPDTNAITDGPFGSNLKTEHYQQTGPRVIRLQNIKDGEFSDEYAHITEEHFERLRKHEVHAGDLVIASLGENPPRACVIPLFVGPAIVKADCVRLKTHPSLAASYVNMALNCQPTRQRVKDVLHGIGRPRLSLGEIRVIALPIPPGEEQIRIVAEVDRRLSIVREVEAEVDANLKRAQALRQAVLARAFSAG